MLTAFFNTFIKQARLWEMEYALPQPDPEAGRDPDTSSVKPSPTSRQAA